MTEHRPGDLGSIAEIVAATGMAKQTVHNWTTRGIVDGARFPLPISYLGRGRIWDMREVKTWVLEHGYTWKDDRDA